MMQFPLDFMDFLTAMNAEHVEYLVVGGWAVGFHGSPRLTGVLDVWVAVSEENAHRILKALRRFGAPGGTPLDFFLERGNVYRIGRVPMRIEIINNTSGVVFQDCYNRRVEIEIDGEKIPFIGRSDLLENKRVAARTKDAADVESLTQGGGPA